MPASHLSCLECGRARPAYLPANLCTCGSPLFAEYEAAGSGLPEFFGRPSSMWRYHELLPVEDPDRVITRGEGLTPLVRLEGAELGFARLWAKDEGLNPTSSFKARGASCGISRALELGIREVALATAGNAGSAWACYGAAAGIKVHVFMPRDAPERNRLECESFGAELTLVDGTLTDAAARLNEEIAARGWFDVATFKEPYRVEGKKTIAFEIAEQLGWRLPGAVVFPTGGGVGVIGLWRGFQQMRAAGWVEGTLPRLLAVQASGCAPIAEAFASGLDRPTPWNAARTVAAGLRVPAPLAGGLVLRALRETGGWATSVDDSAIGEAASLLARTFGIRAAPEGAAALAGARRMLAEGILDRQEETVLVITGG